MSVIPLNTENYDDNINETTNAIIDFSATWCGPCKRMKPYFEKAATFVQSINLDVKFFEIDVDESEEIAQDFEVSCMPTLVLIKNGEIVARCNGFMSDQEMLTMIGSHFDIPKDEESDDGPEDRPSKQNQSSNNK